MPRAFDDTVRSGLLSRKDIWRVRTGLLEDMELGCLVIVLVLTLADNLLCIEHHWLRGRGSNEASSTISQH